MKQEKEIIKQMVANGDLPQEVAEKYFHELKESESEDEKIRNEIIDFIYDKTDTRELREKSNSWLTWLEKQKPMEDFNGDDYGIDSLQHAITILEKTLGEVEGYQTDDGILEHKCAITAVRKLAKERKEQKPVEWSEEDDYNKRQICRIQKNAGCSQKLQNKIKDWLDSRLQNWKPAGEQKPAEWSEKDEEILDSIITRIQDCIQYGDALAMHYGNRDINWLKSLSPQSHWKPSDEQMDALDSTLQYSQVSHNSFEYLNSLFNDLKKLREEQL